MLGITIQLGTLVASVYTLYKGVTEFTYVKKSRLRADYEFARKLLTEVDESTHPIILEKGYIALTGNKELNADEIRYFLASNAPSSSLRKYSCARLLLSFTAAKNGAKASLAFSDRFSDEKKRTWYKRCKLVLYWISATIAFAPIIFFGLIIKADLVSTLVSTITIMFAFGIFAADCLLDYARVLRAEELVQEHDKWAGINARGITSVA